MLNERFAQKLKPYSVTKDILIVNKSKYLKITNVWVFSLSRLVLFSRYSLCVLWQSICSAPHQTYLLDIQFHRHQNIITKYHSQMGYLGLPSLLQAVSFTSQPPDFPFAWDPWWPPGVHWSAHSAQQLMILNWTFGMATSAWLRFMTIHSVKHFELFFSLFVGLFNKTWCFFRKRLDTNGLYV